MTNDTKLKPCLRCGCKHISIIIERSEAWAVCDCCQTSCGSITVLDGEVTEEIVTLKWNRRPVPNEKPAHEMTLKECEAVGGELVHDNWYKYGRYYQSGCGMFAARFYVDNESKRLQAARRAVNDYRWMEEHGDE